MPLQSVDDFIKTILKSGLLNHRQIQEALQSASANCFGESNELAEHLLQRGLLTRFQSDKLLQGASVGLQLGPFQVQAPIGRGGMGAVYLALDTRTGDYVAIKVLPPKKAQNIRYLARFLREMDISTKILHPNIALTIEAGNHEGFYYLAMEYIPGDSLYRLVNREGPLNGPRAARLFAEIASALEHAHDTGMVHRDLKPSNIMITPNDHAKILDLGLAVITGEEIENIDPEIIGGKGYMLGTADFMAPEQAVNAAAVDWRADIYALGCTLYFALSGRAPFPDGDKTDKIIAHRSRAPTPIKHLVPNLPDRLVRLMDQMLIKKVEQRTMTAQQIQQELLAMADQPAGLQPMDTPEDVHYQKALKDLTSRPIVLEETSEENVALEQPARNLLPWILACVGGIVLAAMLIFLLAATR